MEDGAPMAWRLGDMDESATNPDVLHNAGPAAPVVV
jgi:hypothetical protein